MQSHKGITWSLIVTDYHLFNKKLIEIAESDEATLDQRINCYKEIAKYTYPRFKSQELRVTPLENLAPTVIELVPGTGTKISTNT